MPKELMIPIKTFKKFYAWGTDYTNQDTQKYMPMNIVIPKRENKYQNCLNNWWYQLRHSKSYA